MNIVIFTGTEQRGCTFGMKEMFLAEMGPGHSVQEYVLPRDCPVFCTGCKACFFADIHKCPHAQYTVPIWEAILAADLLVFASPTYALHVTAQLKALLDHLATKWMAHSPEAPMFRKQAVIITNAIGQGMGKTARDIKDSLDFWGVARRYALKKALFYNDWQMVSDKKKADIQKQCARIAKKIKRPVKKPRFKIRFLFGIIKIAQIMIHKKLVKDGKHPAPTRDYLHWKNSGWFDGGKPWKG